MFPPENGSAGRLQANARLQKMMTPEISRKRYPCCAKRTIPPEPRRVFFASGTFLKPSLVTSSIAKQLPLPDGLCYSACASAKESRDLSWSFFTKPLTEHVMPIPQELLDILVCPVCKAPVKMLPDNSGLKCQTCRRVYPVRDDIPVMLPEEATIAKE
jgi:uncharacterized protein YbaR (Trm112 family)